MRIQADLSRLASYSLSMADLRTAIAAANVSGPKGSLDGRFQSYAISANDQITNAEAYKDVIVAFRNGAPVLLKDVAQVVEGLENAKVGGWYQGAPAVVVDVFRQPGANVIETVQRVKAELPRIERSIPSGIKLAIVHDRTGTIRASVRDVQFTLCLSVVLVVLVVLIFLRSVRATMIAGVALPVSLDLHLRRHVVLRLLARQPVADGADDRHGLRRRRRDRHDREHRAPYGEG